MAYIAQRISINLIPAARAKNSAARKTCAVKHFAVSAIPAYAIFASCLIFASPFFSAQSAAAISESELGAISSNCSTIRQSLRQLQKSDSKTRTYLGTAYETISNKFITPLNLRLVRNNRPTFSEIQTNFTREQSQFRDSYTNYMRELEGLIAIDCASEPSKFYAQLVVVRERRAKVHLATESLTKLTTEQSQAVTKLKQELKP